MTPLLAFASMLLLVGFPPFVIVNALLDRSEK